MLFMVIIEDQWHIGFGVWAHVQQTLTLSQLVVPCLLITFANCFDPDEHQQNWSTVAQLGVH